MKKSSTRIAAENYIESKSWRDAFLNLNGLNMAEMLLTLESLNELRLNDLVGRRNKFEQLINVPRFDFAVHVIQNRAVPIAYARSVSSDQVETARMFLGSSVSQSRDAQYTPMELVKTDKPLADLWINQGLTAATTLYERSKAIQPVSAENDADALESALRVHFKIDFARFRDKNARESSRALMRQRIKIVRDTYQLMATLFRGEGRIRFNRIEIGNAPAYAYWNGLVFVTRFYRSYDMQNRNWSDHGYGRTARAAMLAHEIVHVVDKQSGDSLCHVSEFEAAYDIQLVEYAIHNPSAYSAFGQHVCYGIDTRFGAGRDVVDIDEPPPWGCSYNMN